MDDSIAFARRTSVYNMPQKFKIAEDTKCVTQPIEIGGYQSMTSTAGARSIPTVNLKRKMGSLGELNAWAESHADPSCGGNPEKRKGGRRK